MEQGTIDLNIGPTPHMLESMRSDKLRWKNALAELIDNSFDAGASRVLLTFGPGKRLSVQDDGVGCDCPAAMLTLGKHYRQASTRLGRFGVGLKDAACWMWGRLDIATTNRGMERCLNVDWSKLCKQSQWTIPGVIERPASNSGTVLTFSSIAQNMPTDYERLAKELGYTFAPGILRGRQIVFHFPRKSPIIVQPWELPQMDETMEEQLIVAGHGVRLRVGIVREGHANPYCGFNLCHHHRIIMTSSFDSEYSTSRICGTIILDDSWRLTKHKDEISENRDELAAAVLSRCSTLLAKSQRQAMTFASSAFNKRMNDALRAALAAMKNRKQKRDSRKNITGTIEPVGTARKMRTARKTQRGTSLISDEDIAKVRLDWKPFDRDTLGEVDPGSPLIWLNQSNAYLAQLRAAENVHGLLNVAVGMFVFNAKMQGKLQMVFGNVADTETEYFDLWSKVLSSLTITEATETRVA